MAWTTQRGLDADTALLPVLPTLQERSQDLLRNNPLAIGAVNTTMTSVVGTGLKLQSRIDREFLGLTDEEADAIESKIEREFRLWSESEFCDIYGQMNFYEIQELAFRQVL